MHRAPFQESKSSQWKKSKIPISKADWFFYLRNCPKKGAESRRLLSVLSLWLPFPSLHATLCRHFGVIKINWGHHIYILMNSCLAVMSFPQMVNWWILYVLYEKNNKVLHISAPLYSCHRQSAPPPMCVCSCCSVDCHIVFSSDYRRKYIWGSYRDFIVHLNTCPWMALRALSC